MSGHSGAIAPSRERPALVLLPVRGRLRPARVGNLLRPRTAGDLTFDRYPRYFRFRCSPRRVAIRLLVLVGGLSSLALNP